MRLEHKKQRILPFHLFAIRLGKFGLIGLVLILLSVSGGVLGYRYFENLTWLDSFYMASMILTGMGPVVEMHSDAAKIFSSFYALYSGIAFFSIMAVVFAPIIHRILHILHVETDNEPTHDA